MSHKEVFELAKKLAKQHKEMCDALADIERGKFGFEFADTDSDPIIDTINYGYGSCSFEDYLEEMKGYKSNFKKTGRLR